VYIWYVWSVWYISTLTWWTQGYRWSLHGSFLLFSFLIPHSSFPHSHGVGVGVGIDVGIDVDDNLMGCTSRYGMYAVHGAS